MLLGAKKPDLHRFGKKLVKCRPLKRCILALSASIALTNIKHVVTSWLRSHGCKQLAVLLSQRLASQCKVDGQR